MAFLPPGVQYTGPRLIHECSPEELHRRRQAKYDELWGDGMGDQLAKGWADKHALPQTYEEYKRQMTARYLGNEIAVPGAPSLNLTEREIAAEEDMLP